ncbi:MAG: ribose 5-phosphate isomerase A [Simkaniaceae bacterium]|nr:ribose 5-phosphate isomerase A [Simkaniaceae bacterium]
MKKVAGYAAAELVKSGMVLGLGTGSTVFYFINRLLERMKEGLFVQAVSSSIRSEKQAKEGGILFADIDTITTVDMIIDGADEINKDKQMIKGGGGALLREKVLADISKEMVVIVDESKVVEKLGKHDLPVEILPFAHKAIIEKIRKLGFHGTLREHNENGPFITDNGNMIYDIHFESFREDPEKDHEKLIRIPGVLETGFFFHLAGRIIVGKSDGTVDLWS